MLFFTWTKPTFRQVTLCFLKGCAGGVLYPHRIMQTIELVYDVYSGQNCEEKEI